MSIPAITVLMPVYNAELYLREAIDSILNQTFSDFELIIINDGSTDGSKAIIESYTDKRIKAYDNETNLRLIATLNKGINMASGKYLARMDADDISLPNRFKLQYEFMEANTEVGLCGSWFENFTGEAVTGTARYPADHENICFSHLYHVALEHCTSMFRTSVLKQHNLYFDAGFSHAEDYELWSRISMVTKLANIQQVLCKKRSHGERVSVKYADIQVTNSNQVKKNLFTQMGLKITDEELDLLQRIAYRNYGSSIDFLQSSQQLLEKMLTARNHDMFFSKSFYQNKLAELWLNVTQNLTKQLGWIAYRQYYSSNLSSLKQLDLSARMKFMLKAALKQ